MMIALVLVWLIATVLLVRLAMRCGQGDVCLAAPFWPLLMLYVLAILVFEGLMLCARAVRRRWRKTTRKAQR